MSIVRRTTPTAISPRRRKAIRLFLVYGSDAGAITERARTLERVALKRGGGDRCCASAPTSFPSNPGRIADEAYSASLFGGEPVIALRVLDGRHNVIGALAAALRAAARGGVGGRRGRRAQPVEPAAQGLRGVEARGALPDLSARRRRTSPRSSRPRPRRPGMTIEPAALELLVGESRRRPAGDPRRAGEALPLSRRAEDRHRRRRRGDRRRHDGARKTITRSTPRCSATAKRWRRRSARMRAEGGSPAALGALALRHLLQLQTLRAAVDAGERPARAVDFARPPIFGRRRPTVEAELTRWPSAALAEARAPNRPRGHARRAFSRRSKTRRSPRRCTRSRSTARRLKRALRSALTSSDASARARSGSLCPATMSRLGSSVAGRRRRMRSAPACFSFRHR